MCYKKALIAASSVFLLSDKANATTSFINAILLKPAITTAGCRDYIGKFTVGVAIDTNISGNWTLTIGGSCASTLPVDTTLAKSGHTEFATIVFDPLALKCDPASQSGYLVLEDTSQAKDCLQWQYPFGSGLGPCPDRNIPLRGNRVYTLVNAPATSPLPFRGQNRGDYDLQIAYPTASDCQAPPRANAGQSFVGVDYSTSFINEVIIGSDCGIAGSQKFGVEVASFGTSALILVIASNVSPVTVTSMAVAGTVADDWNFIFVDWGIAAPLGKGYAVLFDATSGSLLSMVAWGDDPTVINAAADWAGLPLPNHLARYYPLVAANIALSITTPIRVVNVGDSMSVMSQGGWVVGSNEDDCTPGLINVGQTFPSTTTRAPISTTRTLTDTPTGSATTHIPASTTRTLTNTPTGSTTTLSPTGSAMGASLLSKVSLAAVIGAVCLS